MPGLLGKKIGMTSVFSAEGKNVPALASTQSERAAYSLFYLYPYQPPLCICFKYIL